MKKVIILLIFSILCLKTYSQSSEIKPNQGVSVPQFTTAFISTMLTQPKGTVVFDSDLNVMKYWNGLLWQSMSGGGGGSNWTVNGADISNSNAGNVGIGINTPSTKLQVEGTTILANNTLIDPDDYPDKVIAGRIADGTGWESIGIGGKNALTGQAWAIGSVNGDVSIAAGNGTSDNSLQTGLILDTQRNLLLTPFGGNVGVGGANTPKVKLEVASPNITTAIFGSTSTGISLQQNWPTVGFNQYRDDANVQRYIGNGFAMGNFIDPTTGAMAWNAIPTGTAGNATPSETTIMYLSPTGNLALGAGTPAVGTLTTRRGTNFDGSAVFAGTTHNSHFHYGSNQDTYIRGGINGSNVIINDGALGKVGIGVYPTTYKLEVNGTARTKEVIVETGWADYVFDENYQLKSIDEMESFIKENKHLPNIPKASEIEKNGLKVGETNKAMMEKIEELALYIIQLKKEIDILKAKN